MSNLEKNLQKLPFLKERLFCPGPTPVPLQSRLLMVDQVPYHREKGFYSTFIRCQEMLATLFATQQAPLILTSSGTGAMEAALVNFTNPGDKVLCLVGGKFGERWQELAAAYGCQVFSLDIPWGEVPHSAQVLKILEKERDIKAVFFQSCETSTAVEFPVEELARAINQHSQALVVVDGISSLGAHPLQMDKWGIDITITGSQKGLATPPGLAFIACSTRAQQRWSTRPRYYFDLKNEMQSQKSGQSCFTPASGTILALEAALTDILSFGVDNYANYHKRIAEGVRSALESMGLKLLGKGCYSNALTAAYVPESIDGAKLVSQLKENFSMVFAGGQGKLQNRIIRFAHLGMIDYFDICSGIIALEQTLHKLGAGNSLGAGISAFMASGLVDSSRL
jgi:aspartate aminotransferase-like enzyme